MLSGQGGAGPEGILQCSSPEKSQLKHFINRTCCSYCWYQYYNYYANITALIA